MSKKLFGWQGEEDAKRAWDAIGENFADFNVYGATEIKRTVIWDVFEELGLGLDWFENQRQEIGDCVAWGAANAVMGVMAWEIARLGDAEEFKRVFQPYLYAIGRLTPEGGNGRLGNSDGSLGSWQARAIEKYGVLRSDYQGVPAYSGRVAKAWGTQMQGEWRKFIDEADNHLIKASARIRSADELKQALCNGYFCSIASNKGWSMRLRDSQGKSWFTGRDTWPHQMAFMGFDTVPVECVYMKNQWGINAHGNQLDGPKGGGWRTLEEVDDDLRNSGTECFAFSNFNGFPSEVEKPRNLHI